MESEGNRHARPPAPGPIAPHPERLRSPTDEELSAAHRIFWALKAPADESLIGLAAQAVHFETERLGGVKQAEASILQCAKAAQATGRVRAWAVLVRGRRLETDVGGWDFDGGSGFEMVLD